MGRELSPRGTGRSTTIEFLAPNERVFEDESVLWATGPPVDTAAFTGDRRTSPVVTVVTAVCAIAILAFGTMAAIGITAKNDRATADRARPGVPLHERNTTYDGGGDGGSSELETDDGTGGLATPSLFDEAPQDGQFPVNPWIMEVPTDADPIGYTLVQSPSTVPGWFELWAEPRSTRTVGRWLAVQVVPGAAATPSAEASEIVVDGRELREWTSRDRVAQIRFEPADGWSAQFTAFGWSADDLRSLAATMTILNNRPSFRITDGRPPIPLSDQLVVARPTSNLILEQEFIGSTVTSAVEWQTDDGHFVTLTVATAQVDADTLDSFLVTMAAGSPISGPDVDRAVGSNVATAGRFPGLGDRNVVRWTEGSDAIALTGDLPVEELLELALTARPATGTEWVEIYEQVNGTTAGPAGGSPEQVTAQ